MDNNIIIETKNKVKKLGLAFGGGGARGLSLIGVVKAFEENNVKFDFVAGTSAGALFGAFYCAGYSANKMLEIAKSIKESDIKTNKIPFMPSKTDGIEKIIIDNLGNINIEDLKIPFCAVSVDVKTGEEIHITQGNLAKAVSGSCAVPAIFNPVEFGNYLLYDGGLQNTIPTNVPKIFGCEKCVGVDINSTRGAGAKSTRYVDLIMGALAIMMKGNTVKGYLNADLMISPNLKRFSSMHVKGLDEMVKEGYIAAIEKMPQILELTKKRDKKNLITKIFRLKNNK